MLAGLPANIRFALAELLDEISWYTAIYITSTQQSGIENIAYLVFWQSIYRLVRRSHIACGPRFTHKNKPVGKAS